MNGDTCNANCTLPIFSNFCGNGKPNPTEQCDDNNTINGDGCSSLCQIEKDYNCTASTQVSPSICTLIPVGMQLFGSPLINSKAVYIQIQTFERFLFDSETAQRSFISLKVLDDVQPTMTECVPQTFGSTLFTCLLLFPYFVPKNDFIVELNFQRNDKIGRLSVNVKGSRSYFSTRSLSRWFYILFWYLSTSIDKKGIFSIKGDLIGA